MALTLSPFSLKKGFHFRRKRRQTSTSAPEVSAIGITRAVRRAAGENLPARLPKSRKTSEVFWYAKSGRSQFENWSPHQLVILAERFLSVGTETDLTPIDLDVPESTGLAKKRHREVGIANLKSKDHSEATFGSLRDWAGVCTSGSVVFHRNF